MSPRSKTVNEHMRAHSQKVLVDAARTVFARKGYFNCRIADIARQAGMSQGIVYWYFSSKEELLKAVLADGFETLGNLLAQAAAGQGTARQKVDALVDRLVQFSTERGEFNAIMLSLMGHDGDACFKRLGFDMPQIGLGYTQSLASIVAQGQAEGAIHEGDPTVFTMLFFGLFNGLNLTYSTQWTQLPLEIIKSAVYKLLGFKE